MPSPVNGCVSLFRALSALAIASVRYWFTVAPQVKGELWRWERRAHAIGDPLLRAQALGKLADAGAHAQITATLATLSPRHRRRDVVKAIVALEVMYDYLDAVTEQPVENSLSNCRRFNRALGAPFMLSPPTIDYYHHHPRDDDGGYLDALISVCRDAVGALPAFSVVAPVARATAARCAEAQARSHVVAEQGPAQLAAWAAPLQRSADLTWWETAAGAAASVLAMHALIAIAADPRTTVRDARLIEEAYLPICALITLLDSLIDHDRDTASGSHRYVSYYAEPSQAAARIAAVAREGTTAASALRHGPHHVMTVAGAAAYYLTAPEASTPAARPAAQQVLRELGPLVVPILWIFRLWRLANRMRVVAPRWRCPGRLSATAPSSR